MLGKDCAQRLKISKAVKMVRDLKELAHLVHWLGYGIEITHADCLSAIYHFKPKVFLVLKKTFKSIHLQNYKNLSSERSLHNKLSFRTPFFIF